jgi:hypothetical protein
MCPRVERFHVNHIHKLFMTALNEEITNFSYWYSITFIWYLVYHVLLISLIGIL